MANVKNKTWINNFGEVFEGTQKELMEAKGIKHRKGFSRPAGAIDADGTNWKEEVKFAEEGFKKRPLYLGSKRYRDRGPDGKHRTIFYSPCDVACNYLIAKSLVDSGETTHRYYNEFKELMASVEAEYDVIDNRLPMDFMSAGKKGRGRSTLHLLDQYYLARRGYWNAKEALQKLDVRDEDFMKKWYSLNAAVHDNEISFRYAEAAVFNYIHWGKNSDDVEHRTVQYAEGLDINEIYQTELARRKSIGMSIEERKAPVKAQM